MVASPILGLHGGILSDERGQSNETETGGRRREIADRPTYDKRHRVNLPLGPPQGVVFGLLKGFPRLIL